MTQPDNIPHRLTLPEADNPGYHSLVRRHNSMMESWNRINKELHEMELPRLIPFAFKKRMKCTQAELEELQKLFVQWNQEAFTFLLRPNLVIPHSPDSQITFLHYMGFIRDLRSKFEGNMILIVDNFHRVWDSYKTKVNFRIAILSFGLTFLGLLATLLTLS